MSEGSVSPSLAVVPPNIRRVMIPRDLRPDLPDASERLTRPPEPLDTEVEEDTGYLARQSTGRPIVGATATALSSQEDESETAFPQPPEPPKGPSEATRRLQRAIEDAARADDGENARGLTEEEEAYVRELQEIDREVRAHEQAHASTGGAYAGQPTYEYITGPDGIRYAVSGRVQIDTGTVPGDPEATIRKLETVRRAALAPASPSGQDRAVAAQAEAGLRQAEAELRREREEEVEELTRRGDVSDEEPTDNEGITQSVSDLIAQNQEEQDEEATLLGTNLIAQAAFSQASSVQERLGDVDENQRSIDLIA